MSTQGRSHALTPEPFEGEGRLTSESLDVATLALRGRQLIEASAGTGKTHTLTQLVLRLVIERGLEPRQILVVTFTEAAMAELNTRIRGALADRARDAALDAESHARVQRALLNIDEAAIVTIHGFCHQALQELPLASGAPLGLDVLRDENELRLQVVQDLWRERVARPRHSAAVTQALGALMLRRKDSPVAWARVLRQYQQHPLARVLWPEEMTDAQADDTLAAAQLDDLVRTLDDGFATARATWAAERRAISDIVDEARERLHQKQYPAESVDRAFAEWDRLLAGDSPLQDHGKLTKLALLRHDKLKPTGKPGVQAPPHPHRFFEQASALLDMLELALREDSPLGVARLWMLRDVLDEAPRRMAARKRAERLLSFDDMLAELHRALHGARGPLLAAALRARFPAALIDEFQDTDALQASIFAAIYGPAPELPLFLLGDAKQAIYGFRGADLHSYLNERAATPLRHTLARNQRSTPALLAALNALYANHPRAFVLDTLRYTPVTPGERRQPALDDRSGLASAAALELWQLPLGSDGKPQGVGALRSLVAAAVAARIAQCLTRADAGAITLGGRALAGGDIAVLVRRHADGALMRRALAERGVASIERSQQSVHASAEARELEQVLAAWLEPTRTTLTAAALATTLMGWDATAIHALQSDEAAALAVTEDFLTQLQHWRQRGIGVTLRRWMAGGVTTRLLAQADGERRLTNLLHLAERLQQREADGASAPAALLRWLREQRGAARTDSDAVLLRLESDRQLVQIVTLHRAKGLEYPIVFMPFAWDMESREARGEGLVYHDDAGLAVIDHRASDAAIRQRCALESRAETQRLLYVGLTRAVHRCVVAVGPYLRSKSPKPGLHSALNSLAAGAAMTPDEWLAHEQAQSFIDDAWQRLAQRAAPDIALLPMPAAPADARYIAPHPEAGRLQALPLPARIAPPWTLASFSSLWLGLRHEQAAADHDVTEDIAVERDATAESQPAEAPAADDILRFPRGAAAGEALHAVFEGIDFTRPGAWPEIVGEVLRAHRLSAAAAEPALAPMVLRMLADVLGTPLPGAGPLQRLAAARRLNELEFWLPTRSLDLAALARLMRDAGMGEPMLAARQLDGYLRGFIDLVFEHDDRWWIVDWKSNHLGQQRSGYEGAALDAVMREQGYMLQALLYAVALHRWLARRKPAYDVRRHFGGVHYLFLRGMRPAWPGAGVFSWRPEGGLLDAASALFTPAAMEATP